MSRSVSAFAPFCLPHLGRTVALVAACSLAGCTIELNTDSSPKDAGPQSTESSESYFTGAFGEGDLTVLMVVDRSGSMHDHWHGAPKWQIAQKALDQAIVGVEQELTIGALLFPLKSDCEVLPMSDPAQIPFQRGASFQTRWKDSEVSRPAGATPLGEAFRQAHAAVLQAESRGLLEKRFRVVVITDGEPTCDEDPEELVAYADTWRDMGVEVRVMGLPGSSAAAALLNRIAGVELFEDPTTGEVIVPDADTRWDEGDEGSGYVAPPSDGDVDDSLWVVVR